MCNEACCMLVLLVVGNAGSYTRNLAITGQGGLPDEASVHHTSCEPMIYSRHSTRGGNMQ